jgi:small neutral amino acid transporter SnatA (MarC family)
MNAFAAFLVAVNPAAIAAYLTRAVPMRAIATTALAAAGAVTVLAGLSHVVLDGLDVSPPTFRVATGVILAVAAVRWVAVGASPITTAEGTPPVAVLLLTPQLVAVAITSGADDGVASTCIAGALAMLATAVAARWRGEGAVVWSLAARLVGMAGVAVALAVVVDGVKTV